MKDGRMKNLLKLHEAIVVVLLTFPKRTATFQEIADEIVERDLFPIRKGGITLTKQVELRSVQSQGRYRHLFARVGDDKIQLRNI